MKVAVLPAGAWGTALAVTLAANGHEVRLWHRDPACAAEWARRRENTRYLPGIPLPDAVRLTADLGEALDGAGAVVFAAPSSALAGLAAAAAPAVAADALVVSATKGLERGTGRRMSDVLAFALGPGVGPVVALSGPNFAVEVARRLPAGTVAACPDEGAAREVQRLFSTPWLRVYRNRDIVGVELAGALKNVLAIGVGIAAGMGLGDNAQAALITRGLAEITRLGVALGAEPATFAGLAGLGDVVLTCTSDQSRNRRLGLALGRGERLEDVLSRRPFTVEGVQAAAAACELADRCGVELPVAMQVRQVCFEGKSPLRALEELMSRALKSENEA